MITKEQALTAIEFHDNGCYQLTGPRGGVKTYVIRWRRNGQNKLWKKTGQFRIPIKHGLRQYSAITADNMYLFHVSNDPYCLLNQTGKEE